MLDTFEWYSPCDQPKHTYEEVFRVFESCGMGDLYLAQFPILFRQRKPEMRYERRTSKNATEVTSCAG